MIVLDVNILVPAYDSRSPQHAEARLWWERTLAGLPPIGMPWVSPFALKK